MHYEYRMLQVPPTISIKMKEAKGQEAAVYLQTIVRENAQDGWEFFRVDTIGVQVKPGCLGSMFGASTATVTSYVITFRRALNQAVLSTEVATSSTTPPPIP